jgi:hypothetical protein
MHRRGDDGAMLGDTEASLPVFVSRSFTLDHTSHRMVFGGFCFVRMKQNAAIMLINAPSEYSFYLEIFGSWFSTMHCTRNTKIRSPTLTLLQRVGSQVISFGGAKRICGIQLLSSHYVRAREDHGCPLGVIPPEAPSIGCTSRCASLTMTSRGFDVHPRECTQVIISIKAH